MMKSPALYVPLDVSVKVCEFAAGVAANVAAVAVPCILVNQDKFALSKIIVSAFCLSALSIA